MYDYAGAFHVHSSYSFDGTTGMDEIIAAARRRKLDFIVVTDHFRLDARRDGWEGWHDGVLTVVGEEISPRYNHYLALGIEAPVIFWKKKSAPQEYIDAVRMQQGVGLIAHPDHTGALKYGVKAYSWNDWSVEGYDGISIWDLMTDWQDKLTSLSGAIAAYIVPAMSLAGPKQVTLERWDRLWRQRKVAGFGEIDNHDSRKKVFGITFRIFPFDFAFSTIRTHILLDRQLSGDAAEARRQVFEAIRACRLYIAQERWRDAKGFSVRVDGTGNASASIGGDLVLQDTARLEVSIPGNKAAYVTVLRDGEVIAEATCASRYSREIREQGVYRVEVRQRIFGRWRPWIYANPIRVC